MGSNPTPNTIFTIRSYIYILMYIKLKDILVRLLNEDSKSATLFSASRSKRTKKFRKLSSMLPIKIQMEMIKKFQEWRATGQLQNIVQLSHHSDFYKLELPQQHRAIAKFDNGHLIWIWVGSHESYNNEMRELTARYSNVALREDDSEQTEELFNPDGTVNL